jgi:hypothetical protein
MLAGHALVVAPQGFSIGHIGGDLLGATLVRPGRGGDSGKCVVLSMMRTHLQR